MNRNKVAQDELKLKQDILDKYGKQFWDVVKMFIDTPKLTKGGESYKR